MIVLHCFETTSIDVSRAVPTCHDVHANTHDCAQLFHLALDSTSESCVRLHVCGYMEEEHLVGRSYVGVLELRDMRRQILRGSVFDNVYAFTLAIIATCNGFK